MKHLISFAIVLSVVLCAPPSVHGEQRQDLRSRIAIQPRAFASMAQPELSPIDQPFTDTNENYAASNAKLLQRKYAQEQPNYLVKWPALRDLLLTAVEYDDGTNGQNYDNEVINNESYELANLYLIERLRQLAAISPHNIDLESIRDNSNVINESAPLNQPNKNYAPSIDVERGVKSALLKQHGIKKNVQFRKQYMSPCHFKICNMGRKRDVRYFQNA